MGHACATAVLRLGRTKVSISPSTILRCQSGLRGWRASSTSVGCGRQVVCWHSARISAVLLERLIAAVGGSFFGSLILLSKSLSYKNISSSADTCVISILSITANSTSSNNTGERPNFVFESWDVRRHSGRWRRTSLHASMMYLCFRFSGAFPFSLFAYHPLILIRFANRSARYISAYSGGLTPAQASWANKKYRGHRTIPPEMIAYIKQSVPT